MLVLQHNGRLHTIAEGKQHREQPFNWNLDKFPAGDATDRKEGISKYNISVRSPPTEGTLWLCGKPHKIQGSVKSREDISQA